MGQRDPGTIREVEATFARRILTLDGSPYSLPHAPGDEWHESTVVLTAAQENAALSHLAFNTWVENGQNTGNERGAYRNGYLWANCDVVVAFVFQLRPSEQVEDLRRASDAAIDVVRVIMAEWPAEEPCINVDIPPGGSWYQPALLPDGEWALITMTFSAQFDLRLDPAPTDVPPTSTP